jgi:hypothetical protein
MCNDLKVPKVRNWKELATDRKVWNDLSEKAKPTKGCSALGRRRNSRRVICEPVFNVKLVAFFPVLHEISVFHS